ncbi:hypothetical protein RAS2_27120 [Phycisphaerae bacterium RAS2]|nr:hypothetical protein RAS2_27120 [Phycisphaerae bacterium RAS2]
MAIQPIELDTDYSGVAQFSGLRLSVDEFLELPDDGCKYELLDGVVFMSPRPTPAHQKTAMGILLQLGNYLQQNPVGEAFFEVDVHLGAKDGGGELVYVPDILFIRAERVKAMRDLITGAPDLVVEVVSRGSRRMDTITKRDDYEHFGVGEYWIVDPARELITFLRLVDGKLVEVTPTGDTFTSTAVPGFTLNVAAVRETFKPW